MIVADRNLTVTSAGTVAVRSAIDLGAGNLILESTGGLVRIFENITTTGNLTLNGSTGINLNGGGAKTLSGAIITLIGTAQSNRDLTLIASGALTLNSDIDIGTRALSLRGNGGIDLGSALTLSGGDITLTGVIAETANGLTITAGGTLSIINSSINTGTGNLTLTGGTIQIGRRGSDRLIELSGQNVTLTSAGGIEIGRFLGTGDFLVDSRVVNLTVTATGTLTIAADITVADTATSGGDITLTGTGGGIVIGGTTGSSTLTWSGGDITLTGAVTTASTTGTDNFTNLILSAGGNLVVGAIDLDNNAGGSADARGGLILRAGAGSGSGTINVTGGGLTTINAGSIQLEQDGAVFAATEPADFSINGTDVGTGSLRSMVLVLYRGEEEQDSVTWGTVAGADAIVLGTDDNLLTTPIMLFNGILNSLVSITINAGRTGDVTFAGTGDIILAAPVITITAGRINTNDRTLTITTNGGTLTLSSNIATGTGDLTLTSGTIQIGRRGSDRGIELSGQNVTLISASGIEIGRFTGTGDFLVDSRVANLTVTAQDTLTIAADITVADDATGGGIIMLTDLTPTATPIAFTGARTISGVDITLTGAATGTANLTLTARGTLTLNDNIALTGGTSILTLSGAGAIGDGGTATVLTASTVSLAQVDTFAETALFTFGTTADTGSLVLTTEADQDVYDWMINDGIDLTVTSAGAVFVRSAIDLGAGALSLTGTGGLVRIFANITTTGNLTLNGNTGINLNSEGAKTLSGADITLTGTTQSNRDLTITASGTLRINSNITGRALSLTSTEGAVRILADITARGVLTLSGSSTGGINLNGGGAKTFSGEAIMLTGDAQSNRDLTLTTTGALTLNSDIDIGTRALSLSGSSIALGGALTLTGGAIDLTGVATGAANDLTFTINASGTLTLNDNIALTGTGSTLALSGAGAIVNGGTGTTLTASTVSLAQVDAFATTEPFAFGTIGSLVLITEAAQDVHAWMIVAGRNLTVTSAGTVFVRSAIDLGAGALSLTSTGGLVRIFDNITAGGNLTLNGNTGINLNSGGAKTLAGAIITLTGVVASNRDLALNATSGALILNSDITTGTTRALSLSGNGGITLGGALTLTGGAIELTGVATGTANDLTFTINASGTLTLNDNIALTGTGSTLALSGADAIVGVGTPELTASTVSLTQIDTFATVAPFTFGAATDTGSLELTTEAEQGVHAWMIVADRNLTVTSAGAVVVEAAIDLGAGALSLTSTGGAVRITANITAGGDLTLSGATEINFNGGGDGVAGAKTLSGAAITLTGVVVSNRDLTLTASGTLRINSNITLTEAGALSLTSTGGLVRIFANISSDGNITLSGGTAGINLNGGTAKTISGAAIMITGAARSNRNLTITATGVLTLNSDIIAGTRTLELSGSSITLGGALTLNGRFTTLTGAATGTADLTITASRNLRLNNNIDTGAGNLTLSGGTGSTGGALNLNGGIAVGEVKTFSGADITLTGAARGNRDLTFTASGILTINNDITLGSGLTLTLSGAGAIVGVSTPELTAGTVSLTQIDTFAATALFTFGAAADTGSLDLTTEAEQDVHDWMIAADRNLTVTSAGTVFVRSAIGDGVVGRDLGAGDLTLVSTGGAVRILADIITTTGAITLSGTGATGIDLSGGARTISGVAITLTGVAASDANVTITATGTLTLNDNIALTGGTSILTLRGAGAIGGVSTPELTASTVRLRQVDVFAETALFTFGAAADTGSLELTTEAEQDVYDWMINDGIDLTVTSAGAVFVRSAIGDGVVGRDLGTGDLTLRSDTEVRILEGISTDGDITLSGGTDGISFNGREAKTLSGADITLTGTTQSNRDLTLTASGTLRINNDITLNGVRALSLTSTGGVIRIFADITTGGDLTLDASTVINLNGGGAKTLSGAAIMLTGTARSNRNLTITATGVLTLNSDIAAGTRALELSGSSIALGGALTLTGRFTTLTGAATGSTDLTITASRNLRLNNSIDTGAGNLTLSGGTGSTGGGLNLNGGIPLGEVKTFSGADITLTGAARSNRDLTFIATGTLTLNDNIDIGARALSLTGNPIANTGADLAAGSYNFDPDRPCDSATTPSCTE